MFTKIIPFLIIVKDLILKFHYLK